MKGSFFSFRKACPFSGLNHKSLMPQFVAEHSPELAGCASPQFLIQFVAEHSPEQAGCVSPQFLIQFVAEHSPEQAGCASPQFRHLGHLPKHLYDCYVHI